MNRKELIIVWLLGLFLFFELVLLLSLVYFTTLPFFLFIFTVTLKLLSFFLIGATAAFSVLIMLGIRLEFTIEAWRQHLKETLRFMGSSFTLTFLLIISCVLLGALIAFLLKKVFLLPSMKEMTGAIRHWVATQFY